MSSILYLRVLHTDTTAASALTDLLIESGACMAPGTAVYIKGPLDFSIGIVEEWSGAHVKLAAGCVSTRDLSDETALLATGEPPAGTSYAVHPRGHYVPLLAITGWSELPKFDPKDWPSQAK